MIFLFISKGKVALRVRRATEHDVDFMENYALSTKRKKRDLLCIPQLHGGKGTFKSITTVYKKKGTSALLPLHVMFME